MSTANSITINYANGSITMSNTKRNLGWVRVRGEGVRRVSRFLGTESETDTPHSPSRYEC